MKWRIGFGEALVLALGVCLVAGTAAAVDITIWDGIGDGTDANESWGSWTFPYENDEVEPNCQEGQQWDLEGMFLRNNHLVLSGGWNFLNGVSHNDSNWPGTPGDPLDPAPWYEDDQFTSGDIFISTDGSVSYGTGTTPSSSAAGYGYEYIIDVHWGSLTSGGGIAYDVIQVGNPGGDPATEVVYYSQNDGSNPWLYLSGGNLLTSYSGEASYVTGITGSYGDTVNEVSFDLAWLGVELGTSDDTVNFHFTQECGNDSMMGETTGDLITDVTPVPEPASVALLGMGVLGLMATRVRKKRL
jgi:PEP-CTERM motif-containing protein